MATPIQELLIQFEHEPELFAAGPPMMTPWAIAGAIEVRSTIGFNCVAGCGTESHISYYDQPRSRWLDLCYPCSGELINEVSCLH
jgi:hypothetical protein